MKRAVCVASAVILLVSGLWAQDREDLLKSYRRNFAIASLEVKIQIVQDASREPGGMGPLFQQAVSYALDNYSLADTEPRFRELALLAVNAIREAGYTEARQSVWKLFETDHSTRVRAAAAQALEVVGKGDREISANLARWLQAQNAVFQTGEVPDLQVTAAVVRALGRMGDPDSFAALFAAMNLGYTAEVTELARQALYSLEGDLEDHLLEVVREGPVDRKRAALALALPSDKLSDEQKGRVAEVALDVALHTGTADAADRKAYQELQLQAVRGLSGLGRSDATALLIEHFDDAVLAVDQGRMDKGALLEAVAALGSMGTHQAAVRLTQYLMRLNSYVEKSQPYDQQVALAVITNLGRLGDKAAFDDLMYAQYLGYSSTIKEAARQALEKLKW